MTLDEEYRLALRECRLADALRLYNSMKGERHEGATDDDVCIPSDGDECDGEGL